jgi:acetolactate synthase-1/2/3 large subunit
VFVSLPLEFLSAVIPTNAAASAAYPAPPTVDASGLDKLTAMLLEAQHPVIVTQECGRSIAAVERLVELAELLCVPVVEPRAAGYVNFPRDHLLHAGFDAAPVLADADFVLVLEARGPWHPASAGPKAGARVAILGENPLRAELPYWGYQADVCLTGAAEDALTRMLQGLRKQVTPADPAPCKPIEALGGAPPGAEAHRRRGSTCPQEPENAQ